MWWTVAQQQGEAVPPEQFNWEARLNLSYDGATGDSVSDANIIRPTPSSLIIPNPTPFGAILDINGNTLPISVQMTGSNVRADDNSSTAATPDANLYNQRWWTNGNWFIDLSGLDDSKRYQVQLVTYENGLSVGDVITTVTYRRGTNATNLFVISGDAANPNPDSYGFDDVNQIRHDELQSDGGALRLLIQRNGSVARSSLCYLVLREFNIEQDGVQTLRTTGNTDSPLPFVEYVPNGTGLKPAFIFLHGSGERGNGSEGALTLAMRYGPNWSAMMGNFKQDAYAFSPQIGTDTWWELNHQNLYDFITWTLANYSIDPDRIYLIGYSDGGLGVSEYLTQYIQHRIAAVSYISVGPLGSQFSTDENWPKAPSDLKGVPMWLFANKGDSNVPFNTVEQDYSDIVLAGLNEIYLTAFDDFGHAVPQKVINSTGMGPMVDSNYDPFVQSIYDWLLIHTL